MTTLPETAVLMARYNRWMNERLYTAAATLDEAALTADKGAFFGSILGTLNHIAVGDTIWLQRFARHEHGFAALGAMACFPVPTALTEPLGADLAALGDYRSRLDAVIDLWAAELTPAHLVATLRYRNMKDVPLARNFGALVQHFFNHQTHHRGQATTLLFQSGVDPGATDLFVLIPPADDGAS